MMHTRYKNSTYAWQNTHTSHTGTPTNSHLTIQHKSQPLYIGCILDRVSWWLCKQKHNMVVFGTKWMNDLINNIVRESCILDYWRKSILVPVYKGKWPSNGCAWQSFRKGYQLMAFILALCLARKPLMLFVSYDTFKICTRQGRRSCTMLVWIWRTDLTANLVRWWDGHWGIWVWNNGSSTHIW